MASNKAYKGFTTKAVHVGQEPDPSTGSVIPPIHLTSTYIQEEFGKPLAAKSCEVAAEMAISSIKDSGTQQKVARDFWARTCDTLSEVRKILEMHGKNLAAEVRADRDFVFKTGKADVEKA